MNVKEFLSMIDLESTLGQEICIMIPLEEKIFDLNDITLGDKQISKNEKVVFTCDEASVYEDAKYLPFGIEPCFKNEGNDEKSIKDFEAEMLVKEKLVACGYETMKPDDISAIDEDETIDVRTSSDNYHYVYDEDGNVWVIVY